MNAWLTVISGVFIIGVVGYITYLQEKVDTLNHSVAVYKDIHDSDQDAIDHLKSELELLTILTEKQTKEINAVVEKVSKVKQTIRKVDNENYLDQHIPSAIAKQLHESLRKN